MGALQALLTYAFQQRWTSTNTGIRIVGYTKKRRNRRSFEDHELATLCACALFTDPASWNTKSRISDVTVFWIFLLCITTGARLEEVGQVALADVRRDGDIVYLDIDGYSEETDAEDKSVKTEESKRLLPVHERLIELGFLEYLGASPCSGTPNCFPISRRIRSASGRRRPARS